MKNIIGYIKNKNHFSYLFGSLGVVFVRFFYFLVLSQLLSLEEVGLWATYLSISAVLLNVVSLGSYNLLMQISDNVSFVFSNVIVLFKNSLYCFFIIVGVIFVSNGIFELEHLVFIKVFVAEFLFVIFPALVKSASLTMFDSKIYKDSLTNILCNSFLLFAVGFVFCLELDFSLRNWVDLYLLVALFSFLVRILLWRSELTLGVKLIDRIDRISIIRQVEESWAYILSALLRGAFVHIDKVLITYFFGLKIAGVYAISFRFYNFFVLILNSIAGHKEGLLYQLYKKSRLDFDKEFISINSSILKSCLLSLPVFLLVFYLLGVLYDEDVSFVFLSMSLILPLQLISFSFLNGLNSLGLKKERLFVLFFSIITDIVVVFLLKDLGWLAIVLGLIFSYIIMIFFSFRLIFKR